MPTRRRPIEPEFLAYSISELQLNELKKKGYTSLFVINGRYISNMQLNYDEAIRLPVVKKQKDSYFIK
jgi:hypothetical protein